MELLEENTEVNLHDLGFGNGFLDLIPKTKLQKKKQMNWTSSKLKTSVHQKTPRTVRKRNSQNGRKY